MIQFSLFLFTMTLLERLFAPAKAGIVAAHLGIIRRMRLWQLHDLFGQPVMSAPGMPAAVFDFRPVDA